MKGNSLMVRQFMALVRKETLVQAPKRLVPDTKVTAIETQFQICKRCQHADDMDVVQFDNRITWEVCRVCRQVHENGAMTDYVMLDDGFLQSKKMPV